ncbi:MAG: bifunctional 5,10-methylenetetrahydrofolate dehydrogenase/5,10-methenyltetrahydrofolate cyclohydrolase [Bacteriovoracaceae bacterium]|nr:bifunctional 5,10-methylenetetrahydrofolate dehydrogenase/5,10-methenyltetrahydrofolate cyclohydrolase [Bacteriovoracaceae bacterium]
MAPKILLAKPLIDQKIEDLKKECAKALAQGVTPTLKVILVGNHPASLIYTENKKKFCEQVGADCEIIKLSENINPRDFLEVLKKINNDTNIHGCLIQLPVPKQLADLELHDLIKPEKDVDGFHFQNIGHLYSNNSHSFYSKPCTPQGVMSLLKYYAIPVEGKNIVVIGRSLIVGKPMMLLLSNANATVTLCHSATSNLKFFTQHADIIISAVGKPRFLNSDYIGTNKPILIDVGINRDTTGKLCGDIDFDNVLEKVSSISPVPGGVGPLTILSLTQNLIATTFYQKDLK